MAAPKVPVITVLGSLNIDLVSYVPHHPLPGETLKANSFVTSPGGKGANQAVACAKLSRPQGKNDEATAAIHMIGALGNDAFATVLRNNLVPLGVDLSCVRTVPDDCTGSSTIIVDEPTGQNRIIFSPGANYALRPEEVRPDLPGPRPDLLVMQLESPMDVVLAALDTARSRGIASLLNPAPATPLPADAYRGLAHLVVNETEAGILGGLDSAAAEALASDEAALERVSMDFLSRGVKHVIVTLGGKGVYYMAGDETAAAARKGLVPAEKAKVVDTTAAGDTFVGTYALEVVGAASRGEAFDIENAVRKANRAAAKTVERLGAQDSIPWRDELQ